MTARPGRPFQLLPNKFLGPACKVGELRAVTGGLKDQSPSGSFARSLDTRQNHTGRSPR